MDWKNLTLNEDDRKIGGVCGGLAKVSEVPSWLWRAIFLISVFFGGFGVIAYLILWFCMPSAPDE